MGEDRRSGPSGTNGPCDDADVHPNLALLRAIDDAVAAGDLDAYFACYTDDVVVHVGGRSWRSGVYRGKDELRALFERIQRTAGPFTFENHAYLADDEHGVVLQRSHYSTDGARFDTDEVYVAHFRDGKVSELWATARDQAGLDAFFGR